jgi:hypothetical protein
MCSLQNTKCKQTGGPLGMEAHKIYTPAMFNHFCGLKDESEFYKASLLDSGDRYMVEHYDMRRVQRWMKGSYVVQLSEDGSQYRCECGLFEHFGMPCSHILRVR